MPASASERLCSLEDVRELMQKRATDTLQDGQIERLIPSASVTAMRFCDRQFAPVESKVTKTFEWPWEGHLVNLAPYDATKIYKVTVDTDLAPGTPGIELSTAEWRLWPQPARDGTYLALRVSPFGWNSFPIQFANRQVQIEADWGFPEVPTDVSQAVAATVVHWLTVNYRRPDEETEVGVAPKRGLAPEAYDLLYRYKRAVTV